MSKYLELRLDNKEFFRSDQSHSLHGLLAVEQQMSRSCPNLQTQTNFTDTFYLHERSLLLGRRAPTPVIVRIKGKIWHLSIFYHFFVF